MSDYQPGQPWAAPAPPPPYGRYPQPGSGHTARNVVIAVLVLVVLFCSGTVGLIAWGVHSAATTIHAFGDYPGAPDHPLTVQNGQAFGIHGVDYAEGWTVHPAASGYDGTAITGLVATNHRGDGGTTDLSIEVRFLQGNRVLGEIDCRSEVSIAAGQSRELTCDRADSSSRTSLAGYDTVQVNDAYAEF